MSGLDAVKAATSVLHRQAERAGVMADMLAGRASQAAVALLLRNLLIVYEALDGSEAGEKLLARSAALRAAYQSLSPGGVPPVLPSAIAYADRILSANPARLLAHAYVRYLGDLNGGLILRQRLTVCLGAVADELALHEYPAIADLDAFRRHYRARLDQAVRDAGVDAVAAEAKVAFQMNIAMAEAVRATVQRSRSEDQSATLTSFP